MRRLERVRADRHEALLAVCVGTGCKSEPPADRRYGPVRQAVRYPRSRRHFRRQALGTPGVLVTTMSA